VLRQLNAALPPSGPILNALARFDPFPRIRGPEVNVPPPATGIARDPEVAAAAGGVVKIHGNACGLGIAGSGWVAGPDVVVTNAHVVAGQDETEVQVRGTGPELDAVPVHFDSRNDVAVLRVSGLEARELPLAPSAPAGIQGAILGFPQDGPYDVRPARLGETQTAISQDAYGNGPVNRTITGFRGRVREGNSGGPIVDGAGRVVTTVFASTVGGPPGGYGVPNSIVAGALRRAGNGRVDTGPCTR
jgi:S1-C subfamily serine protease